MQVQCNYINISTCMKLFERFLSDCRRFSFFRESCYALTSQMLYLASCRFVKLQLYYSKYECQVTVIHSFRIWIYVYDIVNSIWNWRNRFTTYPYLICIHYISLSWTRICFWCFFRTLLSSIITTPVQRYVTKKVNNASSSFIRCSSLWHYHLYSAHLSPTALEIKLTIIIYETLENLMFRNYLLKIQFFW